MVKNSLMTILIHLFANSLEIIDCFVENLPEVSKLLFLDEIQ